MFGPKISDYGGFFLGGIEECPPLQKNETIFDRLPKLGSNFIEARVDIRNGHLDSVHSETFG